MYRRVGPKDHVPLIAGMGRGGLGGFETSLPLHRWEGVRHRERERATQTSDKVKGPRQDTQRHKTLRGLHDGMCCVSVSHRPLCQMDRPLGPGCGKRRVFPVTGTEILGLSLYPVTTSV